MPGFSDSFENAIMNMVFRAIPYAGIMDNAAASPDTQYFMRLHTADPGDAGNGSTNEVAYTGYVGGIAIPRSAGGWTASSGGSISPTSNITFPTPSAGSGTITHFSICRAATGAAEIVMSGTVGPITISATQPIVISSTTALSLT